jgi:hypothetical protein
MRNGTRLERIVRLVPTDGSEEQRVRGEVFETFKESLARLDVDDRARLRVRSRHQRALGESEVYDEIWQDAVGRQLGFSFVLDARGAKRRVPYVAVPLHGFLERLAGETKAWAALHAGEPCKMCATGMGV